MQSSQPKINIVSAPEPGRPGLVSMAGGIRNVRATALWCALTVPVMGLFPAVSPACETRRYLSETDVQKTVAIVSGDSSPLAARGLGFFVTEPRRAGRTGPGHVWFVTARHLLRRTSVRGSRGAYLSVVNVEIRVHAGQTGERVFKTTLPVTGEDGKLLWATPEDSAIDAAVLPVEIDPALSGIVCINVQQFLTTSLLRREQVGPADDVLFLNAFPTGLRGQSQWVLFRHGSLVNFSRSQINFPGADSPSARPYVGRVTSFGANAGSPVFLMLGLFEKTNKAGVYRAVFSYYLAGGLESYLTQSSGENTYERSEYPAPTRGSDTSLVAIAPAEEILKLIDREPVAPPVRIAP